MLPRLHERIRDLLVLARDGSKDSRNQLYHHLADLFLSDHAPHDKAERIYLCEFLEDLAPEVDLGERLAIARRLVDMPSPPKDFAEVLACDDLAVAAGVIKDISFATPQLMHIIQKTGKRHHWLIAERDHLEHDVWLSLAKAGLADEESAPETVPSPELAAVPEAAGERYPLKALPETGDQQPAETPPRQDEFENRDGAWDWVVDREGQITALSAGAEKAFARQVSALLGLDFLALVEGEETPSGHDRFRQAFLSRRPMRDIPVKIEDAYGAMQDWCLRARADFDLKTGRFLGYQGRAFPLVPLTETGQGEAGIAQDSGRTITGHPLRKMVKTALKQDARRHPEGHAFKLKKRSAGIMTTIDPALLSGCLTSLLILARLSAGVKKPGGKVKITHSDERAKISLPIRSGGPLNILEDMDALAGVGSHGNMPYDESDAIVTFENWQRIIRSQGGDLSFVRKNRNRGRLILEIPVC